MSSRLPSDIKALVMKEVRASFSSEEMLNFKSFAKFWAEVDTQNAYEEEWKSWKDKGVKATYKEVYYDLKRALS